MVIASRKKLKFIFVVSLLVTLTIYWNAEREIRRFFSHLHDPNYTIGRKWEENEALSKNDYSKNQTRIQFCKIPTFPIMSESANVFVSKPNHFVCNYKNRHRPLVLSDRSYIWVDEEALSRYELKNKANIQCSFQEVTRPIAVSFRDSDNRFQISYLKTYFWKKQQVNLEFVRVQCDLKDNVIYVDYHSFVPLKHNVEKRCKEHKKENQLSVLMLGLDSVSRLNFHRTMTKTAKYLNKTLKAVEMLGYNKVGDNSLPNLIPVMTGYSLNEIRNSCWPNEQSYFDSCKLIWNDYRSSGYRTVFAEDATEIGVFNYQLKGFLNTPTDYYWRPLIYAYERELGTRINNLGNVPICVGTRYTFQALLQYTKEFVFSMKNLLYFGLFWQTSVGHDFIQFPYISDNDYSRFLKLCHSNNLFNNTILILFSDHGIRWGEFRETYQGIIEERLPLLSFVFPTWFQSKYATAFQNIQKNANSLTTPFDLHETLKDFMNCEELAESKLQQRIKKQLDTPSVPRGISLFLPIPLERTCEDAGIESHWCTCYRNHTKEDVSSTVSKNVAQFIVDSMNSLLSSHPQCAHLDLNKIISITAAKSHDWSVNVRTSVIDYTVLIETTPGLGRFEATVRNAEFDDDLSISGTISRTNLYQNQSYCVDIFNLKLYCYCT